MRPGCPIFIILLCFWKLSAAPAADSPSVIQMLVPGFTVETLPIELSNQNNLRFAPDGTLTSLGYDGRIWRLLDTNGDGLEDIAEPFWNRPTLSVPLGMAWSTSGLLVSSKGKVSLFQDTDGDGQADVERIIASGWPPTDVGSGGVDATAVTLDSDGNIYFGLLVADYSNAYRLRSRKDLGPEEIEWLKSMGRWKEPGTDDSSSDLFSLYDISSPRGTIQKWDPRTRRLTTVASGMRVPVALAFNQAGDLFNTDQEGETWMPEGNPLDELNHIVTGMHYGFPPRHDRWLPDIHSNPPVVAFGPQHQSACGLVFNEPHPSLNAAWVNERSIDLLPAAPARGLFGPKAWEGDVFVAGESRARIWRVRLGKTPDGYVGREQTIARLSMLAVDVTISPRGELYVCCHGGPPDWGTGPQGVGKIFRISHDNPHAPVPVDVYPTSLTELYVVFDKPLHQDVPQSISAGGAMIEFGEYVSAGDRFERLKPPYAVVRQQDVTPRGHLAIRSVRLDDGGRTLAMNTDPHPLDVRYAVTLPGIKGVGQIGEGETVDLDYDFSRSSQPFPDDLTTLSVNSWKEKPAWGPKLRASSGTNSRALQKPTGDWESGRALFFGAELQCAKCHRIRGQGGLAGPDLSNLIHRDVESVLRDIREPGATLHPDYVTYQVETGDGEVLQGFVRSHEGGRIRLFDVDGKMFEIAGDQISSYRPTDLSSMPSGLLDSRSSDEVRDLLTFLMWEPPTRTAAEMQSLATQTGQREALKDSEDEKPFRLVLAASKEDHGDGQHDYPGWQSAWSRLLHHPDENVFVETAWEWPDPDQFEAASVLVFYFWNHNWSADRLTQLDAFLERGGGVVLIHSAIIADKAPEELAQRIGLSAQPGRTGYRHMPFQLRRVDPSHPVMRGFPERLDLLDEPYWPLIGDPKQVHILAEADVDKESHPLIWIRHKGQGRVFASIPGHYTWTLNDPLFQPLLLRGIAWAGRASPERLRLRP